MFKNILMHIREKWQRSLIAQLQRYKKHWNALELHEKKTTLYKEQDSEKIKIYQEQIKGIHPENIAMLQKVRKYTTKSVEKNTNEWASLQPR